LVKFKKVGKKKRLHLKSRKYKQVSRALVDKIRGESMAQNEVREGEGIALGGTLKEDRKAPKPGA